MLSLLVKRSSFLSRDSFFKSCRNLYIISSLAQQSHSFSTSIRNCSLLTSDLSFLSKNYEGLSPNFLQRFDISSGFLWGGVISSSCRRLLSSQSQAAAVPSTSDGLTVEDIVANNWPILDENESDWKSHASAIAQSIHLIKKRLKVCLYTSSSSSSCFSFHYLKFFYLFQWQFCFSVAFANMISIAGA